MKLTFALLTALLLAPLATLHAASASPEKPNVIVILTDYQGWGDLTCYHPDSKIVTPNMDRLASEGLRMLNAYTPASVCSPTRYGLLTGRYPWRHAWLEAQSGRLGSNPQDHRRPTLRPRKRSL